MIGSPSSALYKESRSLFVSALAIIFFIASIAGTYAIASAGVVSNTGRVSIRAGAPVHVRPATVDRRIGIELPELASATPAIFVDAMKAAAPWTSSGPLSLDAAGNVTQLNRGQVAQTVVCAGGSYPAGDYVLLFDGVGTLSTDVGTIRSSTPGRIVVTLNPLAAGVRLRLTSTRAGDYVRNIRLVAPGYEQTYTAQPFFPAYLTALQHLNVLRFAGWQQARAFTGRLDWSSRSTPAQFTQAGPGGVAPEYLIALANATGDDPWFVLPAGVTDVYVEQFAQLVRSTLDPRLHPIFEYGDAMLQPGTAGQSYAALAGLARGLAYSPAAAATAWYASRSAQIFTQVLQAYGLDGSRVHRVLSGPLDLTGPAAGVIPTLLASPAARLADAFAVPDVIDLSSPAPAGVHAQALAATSAAVNRAGLALWASPADVRAATNIGGSPAERSLYAGLFAGWHAIGGGLAVTSGAGFAGKWAAIADALAQAGMVHVQPLVQVRSNPAAAAVHPADSSRKPAALAPGTDVIAIDSGGGANGSWIADRDYTSGTYTFGTRNSIATTGVVNPAPQGVYQSLRWFHGAPFSYTIPGLTAGTPYTVRLHFAELVAGMPAGRRTFNVSINGSQVLTNFDVVGATGGTFRAVVESFSASANAAGQIVITFTGAAGDPFVNGIEIQVPVQTDALAINAGGAATGTWSGDADYSGNTAAYSETWAPIDTRGVTNPAPQAVYQTQRYAYGSMTYTLPGLTPGAAYTVRLHFAELVTAVIKRSRVFNVSINGARVLTNFDVFAASGGHFEAIVETFSSTANAAGQIVITFTSAGTNSGPIINGIEVVGTVATLTDVAAIDSGGPASGVWSADNTDGTGLISQSSAAISTSGVSSPAPQAIYQSQRYMNAGPLVYKIPGLTPGASYTVRLHHAELSATAAGQRVFNVFINGAQVSSNFDIYAAAGGQNRAIVQNFSATADGLGQIAIILVNIVGNPSIAGIEIQTTTAPPSPAPTPAPTPASLCIGGTSYTPTQDDEFSSDKTVNYSPSLVYATPQPSGAFWSSRAIGFQSDNSRNNIGTDDAYYTDPTRGVGTYTPFSLGNGALTITAVPVPAAYATAPQLDGAHWLSGLLESPYQTYGYVEVSAIVPNVAGQLSAPLWLLGPYGSDGLGNGYEEIDVNEMFGTEAPNNVLFETNNYIAAPAGSPQTINHTPVEVESNLNGSFHTYGILWTPTVVRFFVDRQPTGPDFPNGAFGPMNAIISLGVFAQKHVGPAACEQFSPNDEFAILSVVPNFQHELLAFGASVVDLQPRHGAAAARWRSPMSPLRGSTAGMSSLH